MAHVLYAVVGLGSPTKGDWLCIVYICDGFCLEMDLSGCAELTGLQDTGPPQRIAEELAYYEF